MNTNYTDAQLQAAIDAAFQTAPRGRPLEVTQSSSWWRHEHTARLAIARAFLAALPAQPGHCVESDQKADPYARLKAYAEAGARIRVRFDSGDWSVWSSVNRWEWKKPPESYEVHPDDLHLCPEYAPKPAPWTLPAEASAEPEKAKPAVAVPSGMRLLDKDAPEFECLPIGSMYLLKEHRDTYPWMLSTYVGASVPANIRGGCFYAVPVMEAETLGTLPALAEKVLAEMADGGPAWIPHDGGPCPLKDEEVAIFEAFWSDGRTSTLLRPSIWVWSHRGGFGDILKYRVLKWKPGHGPQAATFTGPDGKTWTRHTPGDPCPCEAEKYVDVLFSDNTVSKEPRLGQGWSWEDAGPTFDDNIIGWRYADEPAQAEAVCERCGGTGWEYEDEDAGHLRCSAGCQIPAQPWTPRPGDVVRLKSGGPKMAVDTVAEPDELREGQLVYGCFWIAEDGRPQAFKLPAVLLQPAD